MRAALASFRLQATGRQYSSHGLLSPIEGDERDAFSPEVRGLQAGDSSAVRFR